MGKISGTKEWSVKSVNCLIGCSHDCRYCYARANALRYRVIASPKQWARPRVRQSELTKRQPRAKGRVMFPTTHDILPEFLDACLAVLSNLLEAGNEVLIVSKPHVDCVAEICRRFARLREQILFRFTIGATDEALLAYWEPGAPSFSERMEALKHAAREGFATSVSAEPLLDFERGVELVDAVEPFVTDTIWIGKLNQLRARAVPGTDERAMQEIEKSQTAGNIRRLHADLKNRPPIRWKESCKAVLGIPPADRAGQDI